MARVDGKLPVFLGADPLGGVGNATVVGIAQLDGENDITITIKSNVLKGDLEKLIELDQIIGLALNVAYRAEPTKKGSE